MAKSPMGTIRGDKQRAPVAPGFRAKAKPIIDQPDRNVTTPSPGASAISAIWDGSIPKACTALNGDVMNHTPARLMNTPNNPANISAYLPSSPLPCPRAFNPRCLRG